MICETQYQKMYVVKKREMIWETQYQKMYVVDESTTYLDFDDDQLPLLAAAPTDGFMRNQGHQAKV
jgi:hypothetical protein